MLKYVIKRVLLVIPTLLGAAALVFLLMRLIPGDVCVVRLGSSGGTFDPKAVALCHAELGMDQPVFLQFLDFVWGLVRLDFGTSMWSGLPVTTEIWARLPISLEIAILATVIAITIAIPLGTDEAMPRAHRQAARAEQDLHHRLVHARRRCQHAGTDIRNVGELQQALHRAVFAVGAVQHREHGIEPQCRERRVGSAGVLVLTRRRTRLLNHLCRRRRARRLIGEHPPAVLRDQDRDRVVLAAIDVLENRRRRGHRDFVLPRSAAVNDPDPQFGH